MNNYSDIINLPHRPPRRQPLSAQQRAAQFMPFAALTGYDECVLERARLTESREQLCEEDCAELDRRLAFLAEHISQRPEITLTVYVPDKKKSGGAYIQKTGVARRVCMAERFIELVGGERIFLGNIYAFGGSFFEDFEKDKFNK